jgi:hypothetical protein
LYRIREGRQMLRERWIDQYAERIAYYNKGGDEIRARLRMLESQMIIFS